MGLQILVVIIAQNFAWKSRTTVSFTTHVKSLQELVHLIPLEAKPMEASRCLKALQWAGRRTGMTTSALIIDMDEPRGFLPTKIGNQLIKAFPNVASLRNLRRFEMDFPSILSDWRQAYELFSDWVLEQTVSLVACKLFLGMSLRLAAGTLTLQWLRHLDTSSFLFKAASFNAAKQLPVLETLRIHGYCEVDLVDVSGCMQLRRLAISGVIVHQLLKRFQCLLSYRPGSGGPSTSEGSHLRSADRVTLNIADCTTPPQGMAYLEPFLARRLSI